MVVHGSKGVNWKVFGHILISWLISPIIAGILSLILFNIVRKCLSSAKDPANAVLKWLPITCAITVMVNVFSILMYGPRINLSLIYILLLTCILGLVVNLLVWFLMVPHLKVTIQHLGIEYNNGGVVNQIFMIDDDTDQSTRLLTYSEDTNSTESREQNANFMVDEVSSLNFNKQNTKVLEASSNLNTVDNIADRTMNNLAVQVFLPAYEESKLMTQLTHPENLSQSSTFYCVKHYADQQLPSSIVRNEFSPIHQPILKPSSMTPRDNVKLDTKLSKSRWEKIKSFQTFKCFFRRSLSRSMTANTSARRSSPQQVGSYKSDETDISISSYISDDSFIDKFDEFNRKASSSSTAPTIKKRRVTIKDSPSVARIFSVLQIMSSLFGSFTHGFNDVSNAIAPLVAVWMLWVTEQNLMGAKTPIWILLYGGTCISIGIWLCGDRTIKTIGRDITSITPSSGFVIELCSAVAVLIASNMGLPVSSTHCKVGSVVCVGRMNGKDAVNWNLVRNIAIAWIATFPVTAVISASVMVILRKVILLRQ
ncbi:hypothetical protein GJ496_000370 [Pomphorhynchus laevis]|nr:hypothetical protein GJ496_000370 [Pomphorhynchus laevis]